MKRFVVLLVFSLFMSNTSVVFSSMHGLGPEQLVESGGSAIVVNGYSVPSYSDWNNDGKMDLIIGEGGDIFRAGKVRVYLNVGTAASPEFSDYFYVQSNGSDLSVFASGCLGTFPRTVYWDGDGRKDLVLGQSDGTVLIYLNTGTDSAPTFDGGTLLQVGSSGSKVDIDVGSRACPTVVDWDNNGAKDMVVGALDGRMHIFLNSGSDTSPDFTFEALAQENGSDLYVPSVRSSPVVMDLDGDGKKDLLTGNTNGQLLFYSNVGTDASPLFSGYDFVESDGSAIDLAGTPRSRPFVGDWTGDGYLDVFIGAIDGKVHLYEGVPEPVTILLFGLGSLVVLRRRKK